MGGSEGQRQEKRNEDGLMSGWQESCFSFFTLSPQMKGLRNTLIRFLKGGHSGEETQTAMS